LAIVTFDDGVFKDGEFDTAKRCDDSDDDTMAVKCSFYESNDQTNDDYYEAITAATIATVIVVTVDRSRLTIIAISSTQASSVESKSLTY
jgi:hypothetical protein